MEFFLEYSKRIHSSNKFDEYERSFEKVGPLNYYYNNNEQYIGNIKDGIYILSNIYIYSNIYRYSYIKPVIGITSSINKILVNTFFMPFEILYINNFELIQNY